jgi:hypothetical protein
MVIFKLLADQWSNDAMHMQAMLSVIKATVMHATFGKDLVRTRPPRSAFILPHALTQYKYTVLDP